MEFNVSSYAHKLVLHKLQCRVGLPYLECESGIRRFLFCSEQNQLTNFNDSLTI